LDHRPPSVRVEKPWGRFEQYTHNLPCTVKIITVAPGGILSRQYHHRRDELWVVLDPGACVELGEEVLYPEPEEKLFIPRETVHRLYSTGSSPGGSLRSPSASSTRTTSSAWRTSTAAWDRKVSLDTCST
jgi:mannose-6-phosphate isomerase